MIFNSLVFLQFALLFFLIWPFARKTKGRYLYLIGASTIFYAYAGWWFMPLLLATATVDFYVAKAIFEQPRYKKQLVLASLVSNLGVLGLFKYSAFAAQTANIVAKHLGVPVAMPILHLVLPVGISFYTFQSLSYIFDVYSGKLTPSKHPLHFLSLVSLFPHLVAGPIVRVGRILPQIEELKAPTSEQAWEGLQMICLGLFKKMVLADNLAPYVNSVYDSSYYNQGSTYFVATIAFALQIYYDFSGYTDCAIGLAKWIGIDFEPNFRNPYSAIGFSDFWSRWHISLSSWVRDYIYIPLGGSRVSEAKVHRNIWVTMLLSGLWHGANWTFLVWGGIHACYQSLERSTKWAARLRTSSFGRLTGVILTFILVCFGWIFFRAQTIEQAFFVVEKCFHFYSRLPETITHLRVPVFFALAFGIAREAFIAIREVEEVRRPMVLPEFAKMVTSGAMLLSCLLIAGPGKAFIYFQF